MSTMEEVAEYTAKVKKLGQQLEEKTEQLSETKEELAKIQDITSKLKTENLELADSRKWCEVVLGLENEIQKYKGDIDRLQKHREYDRNKIKDLAEENAVLTLSQKNSLSIAQSLQEELQVMKGNYSEKALNILSEQLGSKQVELEATNHRLSSQCMMDKRALIDLREELVKEKKARSKFVEFNITTEERITVKCEHDEMSKLREPAVGREDKETAWSNKLNNIQEEMVVSSKEKISVLAQINTIQSDHRKLESELSRSTQSEKEMKQEQNQLLADQTRLQRLHDHLQSDYDKVSTERDDLKLSERTLRMEISKLKDSAETVSQGQDDIIKAKEAIDMERENPMMDKKTLSNLRSEQSNSNPRRREEFQNRNWRRTTELKCSKFRLSNIPLDVTKGSLRRVLLKKKIGANFDIEEILDGICLVTFMEDQRRVLDKLGEIRIGEIMVKAEVFNREIEETNKVSNNVDEKHAVVIKSSLPQRFQRNRFREEVRVGVDSSGRDIVGMSNAFTPPNVTQDGPKYSSWVGDRRKMESTDPVHSKDASEVSDWSVEVEVDEREEKVGEEALMEEVEAEPLQQVGVVFASMDVREKQKVIEQAKQKSLGDFMIPAKPKQGQIKKKKKRKPANAEKNLEDDAQKARTAGH